MQKIKTLLLDLGGVLLNIEYHQTADAFKALGASGFDQLYSQTGASLLFEQLETGQVKEADFYKAMEPYCRPGTTHPQMETAWNAILLDFRVSSVQYLDQLSERYNLYLLSNTNSIHHRAFEQSFVAETGRRSLDDCFTKAYYSHLIQRRKPYPDTYHFVLNDAGITAAESLFIDDSLVNIIGAKEAGLSTHLLTGDELLEGLNLL